MRSLVSINNLTKDMMLLLCERAYIIESKEIEKTLENHIVAMLFFEPSTRTKLSFETACLRTGAHTITLGENSSLKKGESLEDTIRMAAAYADVIVIRHSEEGTALKAMEISSCPVINAGDGINEHPTQTMLDLYTILKDNGSLEGFTITLAGDLKYGRTIHSLIHALALFDVKIILAAPENFSLPEELKSSIRGKIILETDSLKEALDTDYIYMTRIQKERFNSNTEEFNEKNWILNLDIIKQYGRQNIKIMHPLPRINEIATDLDSTPYALYFEQAKNGVFMRAALLEYVLEKLK